MANNLERKIAVVAESSAAAELETSLRDLVQGTAVEFSLFSPAQIGTIHADTFDAIMFYDTISDFAAWNEKGPRAPVDAFTEKLLKRFHRDSKPIAALGKSVPLIALVFGELGVELTTGPQDDTVAKEIRKTGSHHTLCPLHDYVTDRDQKVLTTGGARTRPGLSPGSDTGQASDDPKDVFNGLRKMMRELVEMA